MVYLKKAIKMGSSKYESIGVVIPKKIAQELDIQPGDPLVLDVEDGKIIIRKAKVTTD